MGDDDGEAEQGQPDGDAGHGEQQLEIRERPLPGKQEINQQAEHDGGEGEGRIHKDAEYVAARKAGIAEQKAQRHAGDDAAEHGEPRGGQRGLNRGECFFVAARKKQEASLNACVMTLMPGVCPDYWNRYP